MPTTRNCHLKRAARTLERHVAPRRSLRVKGVDPPWYPEPQFRYPTHTFWTSVTPPGTPPQTPLRNPTKPPTGRHRWKKGVLTPLQHENSVEITHVESEVQESEVQSPRTSPRSNSGYERTWRITSSDSEPETEEEEWCARRDAFLRQAI